MHVEPLLDDLVGVGGIDRAIGAAMPYRNLRPRALVRRGAAHEIAEFGGRAGRRLEHAAQRFPDIAGDAERQARDDGAGREQFGIGGEHDRGHGAAGGKPGDEDAPLVDLVVLDHARDHLPDRTGFAAIAGGVFRIEPVEAALAVVRRLLLGHQQRKTIMSRPASTSRRRDRSRPRSDRSHGARRPAPAAVCSSAGTNENIRSAPGFTPNPAVSTSGLG